MRASAARSRTRFWGYVLLAAAAPACLAALALAAVGWWIDFSEEPQASDLIVVLAGNYTRPPYAADLYLRGLAPEIWLGRPLRTEPERIVLGLDIPLPPEERINRQILLKKGVPASRIRFYGENVNSTVEEAEALERSVDTAGKRVLVVTSRAHARRARLIFRKYHPKAALRVAATPYEYRVRWWWTDKILAGNAILETFKTAYYLLDGRRFLEIPATRPDYPAGEAIGK